MLFFLMWLLIATIVSFFIFKITLKILRTIEIKNKVDEIEERKDIYDKYMSPSFKDQIKKDKK